MNIFSGALLRALAVLSLLTVTGAASAHEFKHGDIDIHHPWSRATVPNAKVAAGYLYIKNSGSEADRLVSIFTDVAGKTEIHEMAIDSAGVMTMRPVEGALEIPAGGEVKLAPKGLHVMFMELKQQIKEGEKFKATLTFEKAGTVEVEFAVDKMGENHDGHDG